MAHSFARSVTLPCPACHQSFEATIWLILDASERPDLLAQARDRTLHHVTCPHCGHQGAVDAPLLVYRPEESPHLLFTPPQQITAEQDLELAAGLLALLQKSLGHTWQDAWLEEMAIVPWDQAPHSLASSPHRGEGEPHDHPHPQDTTPEPTTSSSPPSSPPGERRGTGGGEVPPALQEILDELKVGRVEGSPDKLAAVLLEQVLQGGQTALTSDQLTPELVTAMRALAEKETGQRAQVAGQLADALEATLTQAPHSPAPSPHRGEGEPHDHPHPQDTTSEPTTSSSPPSSPPGERRGTGGGEVPPEFHAHLGQAQAHEQHYLRTGDPAALDRAATAWNRILDHPAFPQAHERFRLAAMNDAGRVFLRRYWARGRMEDLDRALDLWQRAVELTGEGSPDLPGFLNNLASGLSDRYSRTGDLGDLEEATRHYRRACEKGRTVALEATLWAGRNWGNWALTREKPSWSDAATAYAFALEAIETLLATQLDRSSRESWLKEAQGLHVRAAYALAQLGRLEEAVAAAERGQARLLAQALEENRADLERLADLGHGELLRAYRANLDRRAGLLAQLQAAEDEDTRSVLRRELRANKDERDQLIAQIQQIPGYEDFLARPSFTRIVQAIPHPSPPQLGEGAVDVQGPRSPSSSLREAGRGFPESAEDNAEDADAVPGLESNSPSPEPGEAGRGFLVYLLATPAGGLALVVRPENGEARVVPVWLDQLSQEKVREMLLGPADDPALDGYLGAYNRWRHDHRGASVQKAWFEAIDTVTRWLWDVAMGPLAQALATPDGPPSSVILIPTGLLALLPLHAAWREDPSTPSGRRYFLDLFPVTYAPSATALGHAQRRAAQAGLEPFLAVDEPRPVRASPLPNSAKEVQAAAQHFRQVRRLRGEEATWEAVLQALPGAQVAHFSCHGETRWQDPLTSGLLLAHDRRLTVRDLLGLRLPPARLAVLSACETGIIGTRLPDEVVALPSALLQAGFGGVVASLWSVSEISTAMLLARFYELWRDEGLSPAQALQGAQRWLRDTTSREKWAHFQQFLPDQALLAQRTKDLTPEVADAFFKAMVLSEPDERFFAHPFWWAAFTLTGV